MRRVGRTAGRAAVLLKHPRPAGSAPVGPHAGAVEEAQHEEAAQQVGEPGDEQQAETGPQRQASFHDGGEAVEAVSGEQVAAARRAVQRRAHGGVLCCASVRAARALCQPPANRLPTAWRQPPATAYSRTAQPSAPAEDDEDQSQGEANHAAGRRDGETPRQQGEPSVRGGEGRPSSGPAMRAPPRSKQQQGRLTHE